MFFVVYFFYNGEKGSTGRQEGKDEIVACAIRLPEIPCFNLS